MKVTVICDVLGEANNGTTLAAKNLITYLVAQVAVGREVTISYTGRLLDGTMFDSSNEADCAASGLQCHEPLTYIT